jgi:hypothetical protein
MDVSGPQGAPLQIAELVEHEHRVIAGAAEMAVVGAAFLLAVGRAFARIHVQHDNPRPTPLVHRLDPLAWQIGEAARFSGRASHSVSKRPIWLAEAPRPIGALPPTTQRIAGSRHSRSASFTSS